MEVVVTTGATRRAKLQSNRHHVTTNKPTPNFLHAGCPSCHPTDSVKALKGKISQSMDLLTPNFKFLLIGLRNLAQFFSTF